MLTRLGVKNFKSWREIPGMRLAPITGLFGTNSSGKTSLLQILLLLKQTTESADRTQVLNLGGERDPVVLGTFREVLYRQNRDLRLELDLSWRHHRELHVTDPESPDLPVCRGRDLAFRVSLEENGSGRPSVMEFEYRLGDARFGLRRKGKSETGYVLVAEAGSFTFRRRNPGRPWDLPAPLKCYGFPDQARA